MSDEPEVRLRSYRGRLEDYLATASDWLWETDQGHRFVFDGDGMAKSNVRPDRLIGHTRWELAGVADPRADPVWRAHLADLEARRPFRRFEYGALDEDGRPVHFEVNGTPVFDAAGAFRGYRGTASNVTARKQAEEARRESEARLRDFADASSDWLWETDAEHRYVRVSERFREVIGRDPAWLRGRRRLDFRDGRDPADGDWDAHARTLHARLPFRDFVYGFADDAGRRRVVTVSGVPVHDPDRVFRGYRGTGRDVTREVEAAERLRESETRFRSLVENMRDIIFCRGVRGDGAHGYDPDGALLFGADAPRIAGTVDEEGRARIAVWYDAVHPDDRGRYLEAERRRKEDLEPFALEYRIAHPDTGEERWMREVAWVVRDEAFGRTYFDGYIIDVTEQRRREATLAAALARLGSQAGEMRALAEAAGRASRAKSEFLARMSHEIRTPMNAMLGFAELLAGAPLPEEQRRQAGIILETGGQLLAILNDVLDLARLEAGRVEVERAPFRLDRLLEGTRPVTEVLLAERAVAYELAVGPAVPAAVLGDAVRLKQVLANLLSNAAKFTDRGRVRLEVAPTGREGGGALLRFAVADTGAGIPSGRRERLFQPFGQLHEGAAYPRGGAGLGLAISRQLVELMGGRIGVESEPGGGSTFWFELPLEPAEMPAPAEEVPAAARPLRVLVVDDTRTNRELLRALLDRAGHAARVVRDGAEAVAAVREEVPDLVLMDVSMPEVDGLEATRRIRALDGAAGRVPIVAMTAYAFASDVEACRTAGMDAHLAKPIRAAELKAFLSRFGASSVPATDR